MAEEQISGSGEVEMDDAQLEQVAGGTISAIDFIEWIEKTVEEVQQLISPTKEPTGPGGAV